MEYKIVDIVTGIIGGWCNTIKIANKIKMDFYNTDLKLYGKSNGYMILLNEEVNNYEYLCD
jgi:hypothetical protein